MNNDRELLEMAAKAAGLKPVEAMWHPRAGLVWVKRVDGIRTENGWNPLTDDGDALRLAVTLRITVELTARTVLAAADGAPPSADVLDLLGADPSAATRRAIVRAAAEIGKAMP